MEKLTKEKAIAQLKAAQRKIDKWRIERGLTDERAMNVAAASAGVGVGAVIEGFVDGRGYKPPLPASFIVGGLIAGMALTKHVDDDNKSPMLLAGTGCMSVPVAQTLYGKVHSWAAKDRPNRATPPANNQPNLAAPPAPPAGHVGYAPPAPQLHASPHFAPPQPHAHAPLPLHAYGHHPPPAAALPSVALPSAALPATASADALARQLYALAA